MGSRYDEKDIQLDGSLIQGGAHDRWEEDNGQGKSVGSDAGDDFSGVFYLSNWLHDSLNIRSSKRGLRFDRSQRECRRLCGLGLDSDLVPVGRMSADICNGLENNTWPFHGVMRNNVVWNTAGVMAKGNNHTIQRNTIFDTG